MLGPVLKEFRLSLGLTQELLAHQAGITTQTYNKIEQDKTSARLTTLSRIAEALGVPLSELLSRAEQDPSSQDFSSLKAS